MSEAQAVAMEPDVFISISIKGNMVAVAGIFDDAASDTSLDVGVGISDPKDVAAVVSCLEAAIRAFNDADWQLVLFASDDGPETEEERPF